MVGPGASAPAESRFTLPVLERLLPPPSPDLVAGVVDDWTSPGDIVVDPFGRGGWVARSAIDRQRRAVSLELNPLSRLLAEVVLRPPDLRHLDAAFGALGASPHGETSLRVWIGELFATRCATCERTLVADEIGWARDRAGDHHDDEPRGDRGLPVEKRYRCAICRDQRGGGEQRRAPLDDADRMRAHRDVGAAAVRDALRDRFPVPAGADVLADDLLELHTDRQLVALAAILERIESDLRAPAIASALRLAFLGAVQPASRLNVQAGRPAQLRIAAGRVRDPAGESWRERNPWTALEDSFRLVRGFVQRIEGAALGPIQARLGEDLRSLDETSATVVLRVTSPSTLRAFAREAALPVVDRGPLRDRGPDGDDAREPARVRLVLGLPPPRPTPERLAAAYHLTAWGLGREAAAMIPVDPLVGSPLRPPWSWQAATIRRTLEAVEPHLARDGRAILLLEDGGQEAVVAATLAGAGAGYRLDDARLASGDDDTVSRIVLVPPGAAVPPGPRTRANRALPAVPGGAGDPDLVPGRGLFAAPERFDARPFSPNELARTVTETAVEVLKARGEPARTERLFGEVLLGLDRAGLVRRYAIAASGTTPTAAGEPASGGPGAGPSGESGLPDDADRGQRPGGTARPQNGPRHDPGAVRERSASDGDPDTHGSRSVVPAGPAHRRIGTGAAATGRPEAAPLDPVERFVALVRDELSRPTNRRVKEIEPDRWWLADREDREAAATPLADRLEWAVYSLLSTAGPLSEAAFFGRIATMFSGHDLPDEALVRVCLDSYRSRASGPDALKTDEDLRRRTDEHLELLIALADGGHRLGMSVWLSREEQGRRVGSRTLADWLDERERIAYLPALQRGRKEDLEAVDCIWYVRHRAAFLFEVEWTAMLHDIVVRRHGRIQATDDQVRFLVIPAERGDLVRAKLERSPVLRAALTDGNWHIVKWPHLRTWLRSDPLDLATLEPYLGLDALADRGGDQLPMFDGTDQLP